MKKRAFSLFLAFTLVFSMVISAFAAYNGTATVSANVVGNGSNRMVEITIIDDSGAHTQSFAYSNGSSSGTYITDEGYTVSITYSGNSVKTVAITDYSPPYVPPVVTYAVTYDANGGENAPVDNVNYTSGTTATLLGAVDMVREGYTFSGWQNGFNFYKAGDKITITKDITLYAMWTKEVIVTPVETFKVIYNANGGENAPVDATNYTSGTTSTLLGAGDMVREGYTFSGWQNNFNFYNAGDKITITKDITLYAMWTKEIVVTPVESYKVTYNANGAKGDVPVDSMNYTAGTTATISDQGTLNLQGFTFVGWNTAANGKGTSYEVGESIAINANVTLFAQWKQNIYHITYDANGGDNAPVDTMDYYGMIFGQAASQGSLNKTGYSFTGWNTIADGSGTPYKAGDWVSANGNVTLYAQWTANTYTVTFDYKGGEGAVESKEVTFDSTYGELPVPTRNGYVFSGWSLDGTISMKKAVIANTIVSIANDHTLYALWAIDISKAYNITYDGNGATGGNVPVDTMDYAGMVFGQVAGQGSLIREGYSFTGWNTEANGSGTAYQLGAWVSASNNVILYAQWTANTYTVTFDYKGVSGETKSKEVLFDSAYGELPIPTRNGYVFKGWSLDGTISMKSAVTENTIVSVANDHTLYALWALDVSKAFNISYDANGATGGTVPVDTMDYVGMIFGKAAGQGSLIREGYSFTGWNTEANGSGTAYQPGDWVSANGNVTLYAQWEEIPVYTPTATASASVQKTNGNTNKLTITITETYSNGEVKTISQTFTIPNNAKASYKMDAGYEVYVATSGNTKIDACYIAK